jgi:hypothetical protein
MLPLIWGDERGASILVHSIKTIISINIPTLEKQVFPILAISDNGWVEGES